MKNAMIQIFQNSLHNILGFFSFVFIVLNLAFWIVPILLLAVMKLIAPPVMIKETAYRVMLWIYTAAVKVDDFLLFKIIHNRMEFKNPERLRKDRNYLILANHQSWADILILQSLLTNKTPPIRFIVKRELIFMPIIGLICLAYEYPFVRRESLKAKKSGDDKNTRDINTIRKKIDKISTTGLSIINFVEGTRFNLPKSENHASRYKHLLNPHAGGLFYILKNYGSNLDTVLNFTITYGCPSPFFWKLLGGRCRRLIVDLQTIPMQQLRSTLCAGGEEMSFAALSQWLKELWREKDLKIDQLLHEMDDSCSI
jgi:1-acyl-sn-glycerol-3-phosphate acyltransferase